jgi:tetratricopeptide (TPR) repeat protein
MRCGSGRNAGPPEITIADSGKRAYDQFMPEKSLHEIPADLRRLYVRAQEAAQRENPDYAITLFCQILEKEPAFQECRQALRVEQTKKAAGASTGFFRKMMAGAGASPQIAKAKMALSRDPAEAMAIAEQVLNTDPNNSFAHRIIVDAARALELPNTAVMSLEAMVRHSPKDKALALEFAELAAQIGGEVAGAAERALDELVRNGGFDPDLAQAQKNLSARMTMDKGGYTALESGEGSYRDILRNKEEAATLEQEHRVQKSEDTAARLIGEYEGRLAGEPDNVKMIRSLAELYAEKKQFDKSLEMYLRLKNTPQGGGDSGLDRSIADTKVKQMDYELSQLNPFAPDHVDQIAKLKAAKAEFRLGECKQRADKYPTDLIIRFELGQLYFEAGKIGEAIGEFQKAQQNPNKRIPAMSFLAQCFAKRGMNDSAVRTLQNAIKEKPVFDDEKKDLIYNLGVVLDAMGRKSEALEQFLQIYETDINYRDVGAKVDGHYGAQ